MFVLDRFKEGRGPIMSTVALTLFLVLLSSLYSIFRIQKRSMETGTVNQTDHVLLANHILDSSLMGFCLFLGLMIDRLPLLCKRFDYSESNKPYTKAKESLQRQIQIGNDLHGCTGTVPDSDIRAGTGTWYRRLCRHLAIDFHETVAFPKGIHQMVYDRVAFRLSLCLSDDYRAFGSDPCFGYILRVECHL
ncbi:B-cell receptor-associated protein 31 [Tanacetum coccineum]|uniref:Endoplasmic reticulum transmembrane protein n=1 Tax=Tanacetum coccineum TaxID=301880 RepID=A0ABQ5EGP1_9ASTR